MLSQSIPIDRRQRRFGVIVLVAVASTLIALGVRLAYINTSLGPRLLEIAQKQQQGTSVVPARRGSIFDVRGRVMASSRQVPDVFVDPARVHDVAFLADVLGVRLNLPASEIAAIIQGHQNARYVVIARKVDETTAQEIRAMGHPAVGLTDRGQRTYPLAGALAHTVGFVGRDGKGLEGIELAYNGHLAGEDGRRDTIRDARRRALWRNTGGGVPPVDGGHVVLTIDAEIQRITADALHDTVKQFEAEGGVAVVMSPRSGEILAMACVPTYDPNIALVGSARQRRNRAVTDPAEPGSTFKPFIACGALDGGFVSTTDLIDCNMGSYRIGRRLVSDVSPNGVLNVAGIITKSSNIGMAKIAARMGNQALYETIRRFGFGEPSGVEYPGESAGIVHPLPRWTSYSTTSVSFGYEIGVTPLQLINAFCALISDGVLLRPRLIRALLSPDGRVVESFDAPQVVRRAVSSEVARFMTEQVLVAVVEEGGGRLAKLDRYRVLGKTGTAKLPYGDRRGYESGAYLSRFMGAAPAGDPVAAVLVMIRRPNPKIGYYGGKVAAPAVARILDGTLAYLNVAPDVASGLASR